jgi:hypothetical protein
MPASTATASDLRAHIGQFQDQPHGARGQLGILAQLLVGETPDPPVDHPVSIVHGITLLSPKERYE